MATLAVRVLSSKTFITTAVVFTLLAMPVNLASAHSAHDAQSNKQSKSYSHSNKKYDDTYLKKWAAYLKKWKRNPAQQAPSAQIPPGYCPIPFSKKVDAVKVQGHHIYLNLNDLAFLKTAGFILQDAELDLVLQGKHKAQESIAIALNGLKVSSPGKIRLNDIISYIANSDTSHAKFKMHGFILNGAEPFNRYLVRVKKNQGLLKISLYGRHYKILSASIIFKGIAYNPCANPPPPGPGPAPTPTPTPTPVPEDLTKYEVKINSTNPVEARTASTNMTISFSSVNADGTYWCSLNQASFEKCQSPVSYAALANGAQNFQVFATTPKGVDGAKASYNWTVDNVRPVVTITNAAQLPTLTNNPSISFDFISSKSGSSFKCSLDGAVLFSCDSPMLYNVTTEGLHKFSVTAIDSLGNVSGAAAEFQWSLDLSPPVASFVSVLPAEEYSSSNSKSFAFAASETSNFECSLDQGAYSVCASPVNLGSILEGQHLFSIRATDLAGNNGAAISYSWTTDYTAPIVNLGAVIPAAGLTNSRNVSAEFSASEPGVLVCKFNAGVESNCVSPFQMSALSEGLNELVVYAIDRAGQKSASVAVSWMLDLSAPMISFGAILPSSASRINGRDLSLSINANESLNLSASLNGIAVNVTNNAIQLLALAEGSYLLEVSGVDLAGNNSNVISHSFSVDLSSPILSILTEGGFRSTQDYRQFNFSANEAASFECSLDEAGFMPCQNLIAYSGLSDGNHTFILRGKDLAGNIASESYSWSQDATAPNTLQNHVINGTSIVINLSSAELNVSFQCSLDGVPIAPCTSSVTYSELASGNHTFLARAVDSFGNIDQVGASFNFEILSPIRTIITGGNPPGGLTSINSMTISFTADQPAQSFICSLDGAAFTTCVSAVTYSNLSNGSHTVVVKAIDQFGNVDPIGDSRTWRVDSVAPIVSGLSATVTTNSITVNWTTNEPATGRVNYGINTSLNQNSAEVITLDLGHSIKIVGLSSNTIYSIRVLGRDEAGNSYISHTITARTNR